MKHGIISLSAGDLPVTRVCDSVHACLSDYLRTKEYLGETRVCGKSKAIWREVEDDAEYTAYMANSACNWRN